MMATARFAPELRSATEARQFVENQLLPRALASELASTGLARLNSAERRA